MVLLGNSRLEEKVALEKVREYIAYQEYRKYRFILKKGTNNTNDKDNRNFEAKHLLVSHVIIQHQVEVIGGDIKELRSTKLWFL